MLEFYFKSPQRLEQMRNGPWAEHIGDLAAKLYTSSTDEVSLGRPASAF